MRQLRIILFAAALAVPVLADDSLPEPSQNALAAFRVFRTQAVYILLKLDTRDGKIWQIQWGTNDDMRLTRPINVAPLAPPNGPAGRFTLVPTLNLYNFVLLDTLTGMTWQVQWGLDADKRMIHPIG